MVIHKIENINLFIKNVNLLILNTKNSNFNYNDIQNDNNDTPNIENNKIVKLFTLSIIKLPKNIINSNSNNNTFFF
ncbi:hypothetical protein ABK040_012550 [Willaertia magna]